MSKKKPVDPATLPYRPCVGTVVFNRAGLVFIGERAPNAELVPGDPVWQLPQGGIESLALLQQSAWCYVRC